MELDGYFHKLCIWLVLCSMSDKFCDVVSYPLVFLLLSTCYLHMQYALFTDTVPTDMLLFQQLCAR